MPQKLFEDKTGTLSHNAGVISLTSSRLSIGGQQFTGIPTALTIGTATAYTLYYIYAVRSAGNTILVKSINDDSIGPTGYISWKLIGSFYTNAADTFGNFGDKKRWQKKYLTPTDITVTTADITSLKFNNLTIGKTYKLIMSGSMGLSGSSTGEYVVFSAVCGSTLMNIRFRQDSGPADTRTLSACNHKIFVAAGTTLSFGVNIVGTGYLSAGETETYAILEELSDHEVTTSWI